MAIIVYGATRGHPTEEWIEEAIGLPDQNGNPFELIKLNWTNKRNAPDVRTHGFEDAIIQKGTRGTPSITYRKPGSANWQKTRLGVYFAVVPRTKWNLNVLAHHFYENLWEIDDPEVRITVKMMADKIESSLPEDLKEYNSRRRLDMHRNRYETEDAFKAPQHAPVGGSPQADAEMAQRTIDFNKRMRELREREKRLEMRERRLLGLEAPEPGAPEIDRAPLEAMKVADLRQMCRHELNMAVSNHETKDGIIDKILEAKALAQKAADAKSSADGPAGETELVTG